jgi:hypothetical protein
MPQTGNQPGQAPDQLAELFNAKLDGTAGSHAALRMIRKVKTGSRERSCAKKKNTRGLNG